MIDRPLLVHTLETLNLQRDLPSGTEENALGSEINLTASQPVTSAMLREQMTFAEDRGWLARHRGMLGERRWKITPEGIAALRELKAGN